SAPTTSRRCTRSRPAEASRANPPSRRCSSCCLTSRSWTDNAPPRPAGWPTARRARRHRCAPSRPASEPRCSPRTGAGSSRRATTRSGGRRGGGGVPRGFLGARNKTEETFPIIEGQRVAVPGDRARLTPDGSIVLLGRDSLVVNSGGGEIFLGEGGGGLRGAPSRIE